MKTIYEVVIAAGLVIVFTCAFIAVANKAVPEPLEFKYSVIEIDGCEYIKFQTYGLKNSAVTHKGNCKNH